MEQYTDSQYDDDLTVGMEDADESFDTGFVDLFEHSGDDESPIARLKTIVLSIDWEINDEVLTQFNDELVDLKDIWADDPIKMVYVQALEKISKYIFQLRSDAHPNAIKLLLTFYYDLEKIVVDEDLSEEEKREILREDVKKFDQLKQQIGSTEISQPKKEQSGTVIDSPAAFMEQGDAHPTLFNLKACILGMDWEITERELTDLSTEIKRLEEKFIGDKPKMIFLQGIGALGGYIKLKKSNAHADAFKLLYSFYEGLEKIVVNDMSRDDEKKILLPEVEKFELFKQTIASTITPDVISDDHRVEHDEYDDGAESIAPAFADVPDEVQGFQAETEAASLGEQDPSDVEGRLDSFFSEDVVADSAEAQQKPTPEVLPKDALEKIDSFFDETEPEDSSQPVSAEEALRGVDVETEADDDSDEEALPTEDDGMLAPALAESDEEDEHGFNPYLSEEDESDDGQSEDEIEQRLGGFFDEDDTSSETDETHVLKGVDVETEADDDSDEVPLPVVDDEIAPALFDGDGVTSDFSDTGDETDINAQVEGFFSDEEESDSANLEQTPEDIEDRLDSFFGDDDIGEETITVSLEEDLNQDGSSDIDTEESIFSAEETEQDLFRPALEDDSDFPAEISVSSSEVSEEVSEKTDVSPDESAVFSLSSEDEITFEAVDETDVEEEEDLPVAVLEDDAAVDDDLSSFGSGTGEEDFFAAIDERVDEPGEFQMEILDESDELEDDAVVQEEVESSDLEESSQEEEVTQEKEQVEPVEYEEEFSFATEDGLSNLRAGIASLGVELNDTIIEGILQEINSLRHTMMTKPVEKTFLQLLSTIVQHIGQYRYESSAEAHGLLLTIFDKLELVLNSETETAQAQEILLAETSKVLLWQQKMLDRQAVKKGDELTFLDPLRSMPGETEGESDSSELVDDQSEIETEPLLVEDTEDNDFSAVFEPVDEDEQELLSEPGEFEESEKSEEMIQEEAGGDDELSFDSFENEQIPDVINDELFTEVEPLIDSNGEIAHEIEVKEDDIADFVKKEIDALRASLQEEIRQLREQLKDKK